MTAITELESQETLTHLKNLIRIDTTNPPGNEILACRYLKDIFDKEGIPAQILEAAPGRANIIARLKGDGSQKPLLLASHLDVVPVERDKWSVDPYAAEVKDGFVWGRGAVDMKQMTALELGVFLKAKRENVPLKRDLIFLAVADEEAGCAHGSKWLVENHPDLIRAEYAVNEVGGFSLNVDKHVFYPIGVAQKGVCWFKIIATGKPGHGAMPHDDHAIDHVCLATHKLLSKDLPFHKTEIVANFVNELAKHQSFPKNLILKGLAKKYLSNFIANKLLPDKTKAKNFKNMFRHLATPTMLTAGQKENVIPSTASVTIDGRILPEHTVATFLYEVQQLIGPGYRIEVTHAEEPSSIPEYDNAFFQILKDSLQLYDPGSVPVPFLIPGYTDAKHYQRLGIKCYGFAPTKLPPDLNFGELYHGHDERLPVSAIPFGLNVLWDVIQKACV
jgi:acetylornithine deacetylase/succinyl-diaminopimelate desuccinylase-like protein